MYRNRYYFNPETLRFEKFERTLRQQFRVASVYLGALVIFAIILRIGFDMVVTSPKVNYFNQKNQSLKEDYQRLEEQIAKSELFLQEIQKRDDRLYRSVFDLEPIPNSIREGGYGGSRSTLVGLFSKVGFEIVSNTATKLDKLSSKASIQSSSLHDLNKLAKSAQVLKSSKPSIQPISPADSFWMTSSFGRRKDPFNGGRRMHMGIDLAGRVGLKVFATGDGVVIAAESSKKGYGKEVIISHGFGYLSRYAHLHKISVKRGQKVKRGQLIGNLGSTGRSTGPHLHYEVLHQDKPVNPMYFYYENLTGEEYQEIHANSSN